ncbi:hypothetical protein SDC9_166050 [bioreactor metagenome]|uniref:Uncharacterized protein n=1 Tax=bioreactor metagenome TaxID=1076179 RepID=A0A645FW55_9ZZZZ
MHARHHLHQALRAHGALCKRVEAGLDGHDGQNQRGIELGASADGVGLGNERGEWLGRHAVFLAQPEGDLRLLARQHLGVGGGGAVDGAGLDGRADHGHMAVQQPGAKAVFAHAAQVGACGERDADECNRQADERKAAVGQLHEAVHDV